MKKRMLLLPLISMFALSSCDFLDGLFNPGQKEQEKEEDKPEKKVAVTEVKLTESEIEIKENESKTLYYQVWPENATNKKVSWSTEDPDIASVTNGVVYANSVGVTTIAITTEDGKFTDECQVTVIEKDPEIVNVTSVNIIKSSLDVEVGKDEVIQYSVFPTNATNKNVTWDSSNKSVATISNGVVHGHLKGQTTISVKTEDGQFTDSCQVNVVDEQHDDPDPTKNGQFYGGLVEGEEYSGYEFSKSKEEIVKPTSGIGNINVFAFNDFHGSIIKQSSSEGNETGLKQIATFYKEKSQEDNTLIFDQGDTWQGSLESNYNYGALIQDVFTYAGVSARTVGNHDFDWGLEHLEANSNRKYNGDYMPALAANVFDYEGGINGDNQQSQLGKQYCTYVLDNGIKVGVVGVIGEDQITSICSQLVSTIRFANYVGRIKEISDFLRNEKDCDVIIASTHEGSSDACNDNLTAISPNTGKRYVDLVLGGHQHYKQEYTVDGVKFVQWNSNGVNTGKVTLSYDFSTGEIIDESTQVNTYYSAYYDAYYPVCDPVIENMVDTYLESIDSISNEVLSTNFSGNFDDVSLARLMNEAIYDRVHKTVPEVQFACCNYARTSFSGSVFTYRDLYKCFPFDNQIIILDVNSSYGVYNISHNYAYREDTSLEPVRKDGVYYKCAIIDYVALHQNSNREFDRFPDASKGYTVFNDSLGDPPNYRDILYSYLKANPTKSFNASNYSTSNPHFVG